MSARCRDGSARPATLVASAVVTWALSAVAPAFAQGGRESRPEVDPYTEGEPKAMEKAGYRTFAPFLWSGDETTEVIEEVLGGVPLLWVETEHFKLGSSLDEYVLTGDGEERKRIRKDLERLKKRIPGVKTRVRSLDPWLRLHLYAMRLEELFASFMETFDLDPKAFPGTGMGNGPYLGLKGKFCVLLVEKSSSLARYTGTYCDNAVETTYRYYFPKTESMFFGMAWETLTGSYRNDLALWYAVTYQVVENLSNATRGYTHEGPLWWNVGLGRWFARRVDHRWLLYIGARGTAIRDEKDALWEPKVRARVEHEFFPSTEEMLAWNDATALDFADHMIVWSRIDYILDQGPETARKLLLAQNAPIPWATERPRAEVIAEQFQSAFLEATGREPASFDADWAGWVEKNYAKR